MLRALGRRAAPVAVALPLLAVGLLAGTGSLPVPGGEGPTVRAVPRNGPLGVASGDPAPNLDDVGAHPVTFPSAGGAVRARPAVAREATPLPDFGDRAMPAQVLAAYRAAASSLGRSNPGCGLGWPLLAGIGKVESGHAYGGAVDRSGDTLVPILGPVLDGGPGVAAISDTDDGRWDTDKTWDRAVGPMQFIPSSWVIHGQDGNGDGTRDPNNILDSVLAAAGYLCAGGGDLGEEKERRAAVFSYNHSWDYVDLVLAWADAYADGTPVLTGALLGFAGLPGGAEQGRRDGRGGTGPGARARGGDGDSPVPGGAVPTVDPLAPDLPVAAEPDPVEAGPGDQPASGPKDEPASGPGDQPSSGSSDQPSSGSSDQPPSGSKDEPTSGPSAEPGPTGTKSAEPAPDPTPSETREPTPDPTTSSAEPTPDPTPTCPTPTETATPDPGSSTTPDPCASPTPDPTTT